MTPDQTATNSSGPSLAALNSPLAGATGSGLSQLVAFPLRAWSLSRRYGLQSCLRRGWLAGQAARREWWLGIRTRASIDGRLLGAGADEFGYQPIPYDSFDIAMRHVPVTPGRDVFLDYGAGMGRAVVLAAQYPFRQVIGVERSAELCQVAQQNVARARRRLRCQDIEIVNADAQTYRVPDDTSVLFLFNPFGDPVVRRVLQQIRGSLARCPRALHIVYALPKSRRDLLAEQGWLQLQRELQTVHSDWQRLAIYAVRNPAELVGAVDWQPSLREPAGGVPAVPAATGSTGTCDSSQPRGSAVAPQIRVMRFDQLTANQLSVWTRVQEQDPTLRSPYFRAEFSQAVAATRPVEVAVLEAGGEPVGFFPFHRLRGQVALPVGGCISDYHGIVAGPGCAWDAPTLLRGCGLAAWCFDHVPCTQQPFQPFRHLTDRSPYLDLGSGFENYRESLGKSGAAELKQTFRKARKLAREVGPLRFVPAVNDSHLLSLMISWKSAQYRRTRVKDVFTEPWVVQAVREILAYETPGFAGVLSVLYAGRHPLAIHMGMRSHGVLHWWFPAYDPQFGCYSPGRILLAELAQAAQSVGIRQIDLGRGVAPYKARVMSGSVELAEGRIDLRPLARTLHTSWRWTRDWIRSSPFHAPARIPRRVLYQIGDWLR